MKKEKVRRVSALVLGMVMVTTMASGCRKKTETPPADPADISQTEPDVSVMGEVDFDLQSPDASMEQADGDDLGFDDIQLGQEVGITDGLYTIVDGMAFAIDPVTLEKTGPALDPVTHEPLDPVDMLPDLNLLDDEIPTDEEPSVQSSDSTTDPTPKPEVPVSDKDKLPNTGVFLEDD